MVRQRDNSIKVACPKCGAEKNKLCFGYKGQSRLSYHRDRQSKYYNSLKFNGKVK